MGAREGHERLPWEVDKALIDLADWGWKVNIPGNLVPIPAFEDELAQALAPLDRFELVSNTVETPVHQVVLEWAGKGAMADLAADFFALLSQLAHDPVVYLQRRAVGEAVEFLVIMGTEASHRRGDTHILHFRIVGPGVEPIARMALERQ